MDQWKRIQKPEPDQHEYVHLVFEKGSKAAGNKLSKSTFDA